MKPHLLFIALFVVCSTVCCGDTVIGGVMYNSAGQVVTSAHADQLSSTFTNAGTIGNVSYNADGQVTGASRNSSFSSFLMNTTNSTNTSNTRNNTTTSTLSDQILEKITRETHQSMNETLQNLR